MNNQDYQSLPPKRARTVQAASVDEEIARLESAIKVRDDMINMLYKTIDANEDEKIKLREQIQLLEKSRT